MSVFLDGFEFRKSTRQHKKYDVFKNGKYITSFGDNRYQHFHDRIGLYPELNHDDPERRRRYRARHSSDRLDDKTSAGYFAYYYLW